MGRPEQTGLVGTISTPLSESVALVVYDGHSALELGHVYLAIWSDMNVGRLAKSGEHLLELAFLIEDLNAVVLPVTYEKVSIVVKANAVRQVEISWIHLAGQAPRQYQRAGRVVAMYAAVAIAVGDEDVPSSVTAIPVGRLNGPDALGTGSAFVV